MGDAIRETDGRGTGALQRDEMRQARLGEGVGPIPAQMWQGCAQSLAMAAVGGEWMGSAQRCRGHKEE